MSGLGWKHALLAVVLFALVAFAIQTTKVSPGEAFSQFVQGTVVGPASWRKTLREMTPLLIAGAAVFLALRAGLFNIGADGQLTIGAAATAATVTLVPGPAGIALAGVAGMVGGALWALPAGLIKVYRGGHEVISTIMLNNIAGLLTVWLAAGPMRDKTQQSATTAFLAQESWIPNAVEAQPFMLNWSWALGVVLVAGLAFWFKKTVLGYELCAVGANPTAAAAAGVNVRKISLGAMMASGAVAGLAGAVLVLAFEHRFYTPFSPGYGFDALGVALLSGGSAWGLLPAAFLFALLSAGTTALQVTGIPKGLGGILLGVLIIVFASVRYRRLGHAVD